MKFLIDENLSPSLVAFLKQIGYEARHVYEVGLNKTPDFKIVHFAEKSGEIIITHDTDFGEILAFSSQNKPSVILIRRRIVHYPSLFQTLKDNLPSLEASLGKGVFIVLDEDKIRVRLLPIR